MLDVLDMWYIKATTNVKRMMSNERGDTNFISIIIILGIVLIVAAVFIGFKDKIVGLVDTKVQGFTLD